MKKQSFNPVGIGTHSVSPTGSTGEAMFDLGKFDNPESLAKQARCQAKLVGVLTEYDPKK
jgi:hypothetical protein